MKFSNDFKNKRFLSYCMRIAMLFAMMIPARVCTQVVSPLQSGHYTPSAQNVRDYANPVPGIFPLWYNLYAYGDTYIDQNGNKFTNLNQIFPNTNVDVAMDINAFATIPMIFFASDKISFLGNANYLGGISFNYASAKAKITTKREGVIIDSTFTRSTEGRYSGFGDMFILPLGLSWGMEKADITLTYGIAAPTGKYETGGEDNLGLGFWTHQFQGFGYYYPVVDKSSAIMIGLTYELNSEIKDAKVRPGNRFSIEYGISQYLSSRFELFAQGGHNFQVSDDRGSDVYWDASVHDRKSTVAFGAMYWPWKQRLAISAKYGFDYGARSQFLSNYWMLNILFITNLLTGN